MSTKIDRAPIVGKFVATAFGLLFATFTMSSWAAPGNGESDTATKTRSSISLHHVSGGRATPVRVKETVEDHGALIVSGKRDRAVTRGGLQKPSFGDAPLQNTSLDYWFFDADVVLFNDDDNDGYYHGIDLLFDVDTNFLEADVFAVFYLSFEGGPWNEYAESEDFTIFGASADDEYVLISELMSGYPTGSYDLLIEIFDAFDGTFLTSFGPDETSELSLLALEDFELDTPVQNVQVVVNQGGGGGSADGWLLSALLLLLVISAIGKIWRHRNDALIRIDTPAPCWQQYADSQQRSPGH